MLTHFATVKLFSILGIEVEIYKGILELMKPDMTLTCLNPSVSLTPLSHMVKK